MNDSDDEGIIGCFLIVVALMVVGLFIWHNESLPKPPDPPPTPEQVEIQKLRSNWSVQCEGDFPDDKSYAGVHRIYRLKNVDGTELIAITGVGIERGSHKSGKTMVEDER